MSSSQVIAAALTSILFLSSPVLAQVHSDYFQKHGGATADNPRAANNPDAVPSGMLRQTADAYVRLQRHAAMKPMNDMDQESEIEMAGLTPVEYKHVMMLVQTDKTLRKEFITDVRAVGGHVPERGEIPAPNAH